MYKIASAEITHLDLIKAVAKTGKKVIFSTGGATFNEIEQAFLAASVNQTQKPTILYCADGYPTDEGSMLLESIPFLSGLHKCDVGLSVHSRNHTPTLVGVMQGAKMIELHVKPDDEPTNLADDAFSFGPRALSSLVTHIEEVCGLIRNTYETSWNQFIAAFDARARRAGIREFRRGTRWLFSIEVEEDGNTYVGRNDFVVSRPACEIPPGGIQRGKLARSVKAGDPVRWDDFEPGTEQPSRPKA
jgi:sialic acid synthase SpsE